MLFKSKEDLKRNKQDYYQMNKDKIKAYNREYCRSGRFRDWQREYYKRIKNELYILLGAKCSKCGFADFRALHIDHVYGDAYKDRKRRNNSSYYLYVLKQVKLGSKRYQLLCANCNWIKRIENKEDGRRLKEKWPKKNSILVRID